MSRNCTDYSSHLWTLYSNGANSLQSGVEPKSAQSSKRWQNIGCKLQTDLPHLYSLQGLWRYNINGITSGKALWQAWPVIWSSTQLQKKRSCGTQLTMLFEDLARNTSAGKQTDLILLDFSKAFDKVNLSKLIWKLYQYGIRGNALSWIWAFQGNRSQMVVIEGEESGSVPVSSRVPQDSVLGPILFHVFINDIPEKLSWQVRLSADDTAVYIHLTIGGLDDGTELQKDLYKLSFWESQWDMEFNPSRCQVVRVTTARKAINRVYTLHGQILEVVTRAKNLGVDISSGLSWNSNIDRITGNANRTLGYIRRNIK